MMAWLGGFTFNFTSFFAAAGLMTGFALVIWWIVRKRLRDFWLPILRIISLPVSRLPRIIIERPPLIPFLLFVLCATAFLLWSLEPKTKIWSKDEPDVRKVHIFIDMSPSVSGYVSLDQLAEKIAQLMVDIGPKSRVSFGTSHGDNIYEMTETSVAADVIKRLGFHRGGVKIGSGVRSQITKVGDVDQLFVVSDHDQHSWAGFQWRYLSVDGDVAHLDLDDPVMRASTPNVFIQDVRYLSSTGAATMDWEVDISLGVLTAPITGTLKASVGGDLLGEVTWDVQLGKRSATVGISWPASKIDPDLVDLPVEWSIQMPRGDLLEIDNKFLSPLRGRRDRAVLIGEPSGELRLEDPLVPLESALKVSGYSVARYDQWPNAAVANNVPNLENSGVIAILGDDTKSVDFWCPKDVLRPMESQRKHALWLMPAFLKASFSPLCRCLAQLEVGVSLETCQGVHTRNDWVETLRSVGAKQIGGDLGENAGSVAMMIHGDSARRDILAFTVPMRPSPEIGLTWGVFPLLVKDLMAFSTGDAMSGDQQISDAKGRWPRIADVAQARLTDDEESENWTQTLRSTNVPVGESLGVVVDAGELPPTWLPSAASARGMQRHGKEDEDASGWIKVLSGLIIILMGLEIVWFFRLRDRKHVSSQILLLAGFFVLMAPDPARARAQIDLLGIDSQGAFTFQALAREVSSRTSLELLGKPEFFAKFDDHASSNPWIWTDRVALIASKDGHISEQGRLWMKRGGILIFDGPQPAGSLEKLLEPLLAGAVKSIGWMAVPPDHEFMRSFYLLNSLPTCRGKSWRIFSFDGRVAAIESPYSNLKILQDKSVRWPCENSVNYEQHVRVFVNLLMMAFTTDYKRDQIHLPEILKRLRVP